MRIKIFFLILASFFLTYLIFTTNIENKISIMSFYDRTTTPSPNFNDYLKSLLENTIDFTYTEYTKKNLEIENVIASIKENENNIHEKIHDSKILIIYLGEFELLKEEMNISELTANLNILFKELRKLNNYQIIYISPPSLSMIYSIKDLCKSKNIDFLASSSNQDIIAKNIKKNITTAWNIF